MPELVISKTVSGGRVGVVGGGGGGGGGGEFGPPR